MRWTEKYNHIPEEGTIKKVTKFLILPMCLGGECRWLEKTTICYEYKKWLWSNDGKGCDMLFKWVPVSWGITTEDELRENLREIKIVLRETVAHCDMFECFRDDTGRTVKDQINKVLRTTNGV